MEASQADSAVFEAVHVGAAPPQARSANAEPLASDAQQQAVQEPPLHSAVPVTPQFEIGNKANGGRGNGDGDGAVSDSDAGDTAEDETRSELGGRGSPLPAILPDHRNALPRTWTGAFADPLTEKVYQADAHAVLYPALVLVVCICIVLRIGTSSDQLTLTAVSAAGSLTASTRTAAARSTFTGSAAHITMIMARGDTDPVAGSWAIWNATSVDLPAVVYILRGITFAAFALLLVLATVRLIRHRRHQASLIDEWPHTYLVFETATLMTTLVPSFTVGECIRETHTAPAVGLCAYAATTGASPSRSRTSPCRCVRLLRRLDGNRQLHRPVARRVPAELRDGVRVRRAQHRVPLPSPHYLGRRHRAVVCCRLHLFV